jgi:hypothetical protein
MSRSLVNNLLHLPLEPNNSLKNGAEKYFQVAGKKCQTTTSNMMVKLLDWISPTMELMQHA